jgi:hypothetical protein
MKSINKYIVETYKEDRALKAEVKNGFAMVQQKVTVKGLKLLADAVITMGGTALEIPAGSVVFIKEGALQSQPWAKAAFSAEGVEGDFMIVEPNFVEFVSQK